MKLIEALNWRYATKEFDTTKKIAPSDLEQIKEAVRLSASSYGLQAYKILIIEDVELREKLKAAAYGQPQITDASQLVIFCNYNEVTPEYIDSYIERIAETRNLSTSDLKGFADTMKGATGSLSAEQVKTWTAKQTYIALGTLLSACGELKIDACPMEGFDAAKFNDILGLTEQGLSAAVIATIGYRSTDDALQHAAKVRKSKEDLFETI